MAGTTSHGLLREARALFFTLVCVSLSAPLHSWAHGHAPAPTAVLGGAGLVLIAAIVLPGRRRGLPVIAGMLVLLQAGLHELFTLVPAHDGHAMVHAQHSATLMASAHVLARPMERAAAKNRGRCEFSGVGAVG